MVRSLVSMLIVAVIILVSSIYEANYISKQFNEFSDLLEILYLKVDDETATKEDVYTVQTAWISKKQHLHVFIPHNEIKEFDLWIAEAVTLVEDKKWEDAISKIEVLKELAEQIPRTFVISYENIL